MCSGGAPSAAESLELIQAGLAGLAALGIDGYGLSGLGKECEEILRAVGGLQRQAARRLARFDSLGSPAAEDAPSLSGWLGRRCRLRPWEACQLATTASRLTLRDQACLAGTVQATITLCDREHVAEIAWVVGTPWQGRGIATEAARGLIAWLGQQPVQTIIAHIHPDHRASAAVATAAGLIPTSQWHEGEVRWHLTVDNFTHP